jgi:oligosaccharide repeat unit polymerase
VYFAVWGLVLGAMVLLPHDYLALDTKTWVIVAASSAAFAVGCLAAYETRLVRPGRAAAFSYDEVRLRTWYKLGLVLLAGYTILQIYLVLPLLKSAGGLAGVFGGEGLEFREAQVAFSAEQAASPGGSGILLGLLGYVLFVGMITLFWAGWFARRGEWGWALAPLILNAAYSLLTLQRFTFVYSLAMFLFSYLYHRDAVETRSRSRTGLWVLAIMAAAVVLIPLALRHPEYSGAERLQSVYDYFLSGIAGLNTVFAEGLSYPEPYPGYGAWTFYGAAEIFVQFGGSFVLARPNFEFINVGTTEPFYNNVFSWIVYPLYDFGVVGLIAFAVLGGFVATRLHDAVTRRGRFDLIPAAAIAMTTVLMSFFSLSMLRDARWLFLIAISVALSRLVLVREAAAPQGVRRARVAPQLHPRPRPG